MRKALFVLLVFSLALINLGHGAEQQRVAVLDLRNEADLKGRHEI